MPHRIFLAIPASPGLQQQAFEFQQQHSNLHVRWLSGHNLHITLVPPWEEDNIETVIEILNRHYDRPQHQMFGERRNPYLHEKSRQGSLDKARDDMRVIFTSASFGPNPNSPRLIWATGETPKALPELKSKLESILNTQPEQRDFKTHITLARFRPDDFKTFPSKSLIEQIHWGMPVDSFVLYESHLSPSGAEYEILETFKFV